MNRESKMNLSDFNCVYEQYVDLVYYTAYDVIHDYHLAQDVCQEVFEKMFFHVNELEMDRIKGWILVTAENTAIDFLRKRNRYREYSEGDPELPRERSDCGEFQKSVERKDFFRYVFAELHEKNPEWYEIILGMDIAGCRRQEWRGSWESTENNLRVKRTAPNHGCRKKIRY